MRVLYEVCGSHRVHRWYAPVGTAGTRTDQTIDPVRGELEVVELMPDDLDDIEVRVRTTTSGPESTRARVCGMTVGRVEHQVTTPSEKNGLLCYSLEDLAGCDEEGWCRASPSYHSRCCAGADGPGW